MKTRFNTTLLREILNTRFIGLTLMVVAIIVGLPFLPWLSALPVTLAEYLFYAWLLIWAVGGTFLLRRWAANLQREEDRIQNLQQGAQGEQRLIRELSAEERTQLVERENFLNRSAKNNFLFALLGAGLYWAIIAAFLPLSVALNVLFWCLLGAIFLGLLLAQSKLRISRKLHLDLHLNAVAQVEGELIREIYSSNYAKDVAFIVGGIRFTEREYPELEQLADRFREDEVVRIVFSPYSNTVWSVESPEHAPTSGAQAQTSYH